MRRFYLLGCWLLLLTACQSESDPSSQGGEGGETPPVLKEIYSTLQEDLTLHFGKDSSLCYADCFGDCYHVGLYMWGFYFQEYNTKEQLYIEVMHPDFSLEIPVGVYEMANDLARPFALLPGQYDEEGYPCYSWYMRISSSGEILDQAPISQGVMTLRLDGEERYVAHFELQDDAGHAITGDYSGGMYVEDFRID